MNLLFVASRFPYPPVRGDRARGYHQLRSLSKRHQITLVAPIFGETDPVSIEAVRAVCHRLETVKVPAWKRVSNLVEGAVSHLPLQTLYYCDRRILARVAALSRDGGFDLAHVQMVRMARVASALGGIPRVLDLIDALSLNWYRRAEHETLIARGAVRWEANRIAQYERALLEEYDQVVVCSPADRQAIGERANLHVVPNGFDSEEFYHAQDQREQSTIIFTGRMAYFPNADAAAWFGEEVFPLVRAQIPDARFLIVGAEPPGRVASLAKRPGIEVTGYVPSLSDYLRRATVAVCPMRSGSGMQFKVLEAMATGVPVVATPYALGGIDVHHEEHLLIAPDAPMFASQVVRLMNDTSLRAHLSENGLRLVRARYTWEQTVDELEDVYRLAVRRRPS